MISVAIVSTILLSLSACASTTTVPLRSRAPDGVALGPSVARSQANLISDGTFAANPGPWNYTNGSTGVVTSTPDPPKGARLGASSASVLFDAMDDIAGATPWTPVSFGVRATSTISQVASPNVDGFGAMRDNVSFTKANSWAGATRNVTPAGDWSRFTRLGVWMDLASPGTFSAHVVVTDQNGRSSAWITSLSSGWSRYPVDLNASSIDLGSVSGVTIGFYGASGTSATIYVDELVLINATNFAEAAHVSQSFTKALSTGSTPGSLVLHYHVASTTADNVASTLEVTVGTTVEWSERPVAAGNSSITVDLSADPALAGTGTFTLAFSLELDRTSWEEAGQSAWIDNVSLIVPGTLARLVLSPATVTVPLNQTTVFSAHGEDPSGNPVSLVSLNWSATIGRIVPINTTSAKFYAPAAAGTGSVSVSASSVTGTANVTVGVPIVAVPIAVSVWHAVLWPGSALIGLTLAAVGAEAFRRSRIDPFRIEEVLLITRDGRLIAHRGSGRALQGDRDVLAGMLTAVMAFAQDSFMTVAHDPARAEWDGLHRFDVGGKKVALERGRNVYVAAIGTGRIRPRELRSLRRFLADLERHYGDRLQHWSGMVEDLPGVEAKVGELAAQGRYHPPA